MTNNRPAGSDEGFIVSNVDCGSCPNITDGCRGLCEKIELNAPRWSANWHMQEFYESKFGAHVRAEDYYTAQAELAALREELARIKTISDNNFGLATDRYFALKAAEQRNATCNAEIVAMVESALRRSFSLGQIYWQQADSDSTCQQNKSDQTLEVQAQHILNVVKSINDLAQPTESGASE